jgi:transcriptional regulator with XRE-family HTH domain
MATLQIKELRKRAGLSQVELATAAGIAQSTVSRLERGEIGLDANTTERLSAALRCAPEDLVDADAPLSNESHDSVVIPSMSQRAGWSDVLARAKGDAPEIEDEDWYTLEHAPGLFAVDVPLTPALLIDLARVVRRHRPPKR